MHQHDNDLIMALAQGDLDATSAAAARAEIASCSDCVRDLEAQEFALQQLRALPAAGLTELESARMHRAVRSELGIGEVARFEPSKPRRRLPVAALATAAAVLIAVVAVAPGLDLIGSGDSDTAATISAEQAATTAVADLDRIASGQTESGEGGTDAPGAPSLSTTLATLAVPGDDGSVFGFFADSPDLLALRRSFADENFDPEKSRQLALQDSGAIAIEEDENIAVACISVTLSITDDFVDGFQVAKGILQERDVIYVVYLAEELEQSALVAHAADNCEELGRAGP